jgi:transposase
VRTRLEREWAHVELLTRQMKALVAERHAIVCEAQGGLGEQVRRLARLRGVGEHSAWVFAAEFFAWRRLRNRRQVGAIAGLVPTPHQSGTLEWEQGISKAGNRHVRALAIQIAWSWVRRQPKSALTQWYQSRFGGGGPRARKIGIVAVARRLLIALWRYVDAGVLPEGATLGVKRGAPAMSPA